MVASVMSSCHLFCPWNHFVLPWILIKHTQTSSLHLSPFFLKSKSLTEYYIRNYLLTCGGQHLDNGLPASDASHTVRTLPKPPSPSPSPPTHVDATPHSTPLLHDHASRSRLQRSLRRCAVEKTSSKSILEWVALSVFCSSKRWSAGVLQKQQTCWKTTWRCRVVVVCSHCPRYEIDPASVSSL